jgi:hypothetical protein
MTSSKIRNSYSCGHVFVVALASGDYGIRNVSRDLIEVGL